MNIPVQLLARPAAKIVLATTGSMGEVYPFIAIGAGLRARGHVVTVATSPLFRDAVEDAGVRFCRMRPDLSADPEFQARVWDPKTGAKFWFEEVVMPVLRESYQDLLDVAKGADLLISRGPALTAPLVAEVTGIPWLTTKLSPAECMSSYDPPHPGVEWQANLLRVNPHLSTWFIRQFLNRVRKTHLGGLQRLRAELGLPPSNHARYWGQVEPRQCLMLFSRVLGEPQPDWPAFRQTGFVFRDDAQPVPPLAPELETFLANGPAPIVFTLGSQQFGPANKNFLRVSLEAAQRLGRRAVLLTGNSGNRAALPEALPTGIIAVEQAWHGALFPRASVVVNHCGVGTTGVALRSGRPQLAVPFAFDQPDNARRLERLGVAITVKKGDWSVDSVITVLRQLTSNPAYTRRACEIARQMGTERGLESACDVIENVLADRLTGAR